MSKLILIPTPISEQGILETSKWLKESVASLRYFVVEDLRTARRILRKYNFIASFDTEVNFFTWDKHQSLQDYSVVKQWLSSGVDIGLMSEAGLPCIADPGNEVVMLAHQYNYTIQPLSGASSILLALVASGFNGQNFSFNGYLPIDKAERMKKIKQLEIKVLQDNQTQIFMETPYRNLQLYSDLIQICSDNLSLSIAADITGDRAFIRTLSIRQWKKSPQPEIYKLPTIFGLGK